MAVGLSGRYLPLVGELRGSGHVENCYAVLEGQDFPTFAYLNNGTIKLCYAEDGVNNYMGTSATGSVLSNHGNFTATDPTHTYGYMYWDNTVTVAEGQTNPCVVDTIKYTDTQIDRWPGLLSTLEYWVDSINYWDGEDLGNRVTDVANSYLPDGTGNVANWDFYSFYEPEYHWINLKRNSASHHHFDMPYDHIVYENEDTLVAGKGYMAAIKKDSYLCNTGTLNGPANPVSITLTKISHEPGIEELGYNLLGNPYQAYLDVNKFLGDNNLSSYWVYIAESDNYVAGNASASENPVLPSSTLHPHQGFFVLANSNGQTVNFNYNTMALATPAANSYFRGDKINYPLVNLFATSEKGKKDLTVIEFNRPEFGGSYKMRAINNADFELAAYAHNSRYSILFTEEGTEKVPVHFKTTVAGTFTLTWSTYHGNFTSLFLVDNLTGTRTDMLRSDHYTFNGTPDDYDARFYITFKCTGVEEYSEMEEDFAWYNGNEWVINGTGTLQVIDVLGRQLLSKELISLTSNLSSLTSPGVYLLRLIDGNKVKTQKIVVR